MDKAVYKVMVWYGVKILEFSFWNSGITCVLYLKTFHQISWIRTRIDFLYIKQVPSITGYDILVSNAVVLGSNPLVVILM